MKPFNVFLNMIFKFSFLFVAIYLKALQFDHLTQSQFRFRSLWENPVFKQTQRGAFVKDRLRAYTLLTTT